MARALPRQRWRCYVLPCAGEWHTDGTWREHWDANHLKDSGMTVERDGSTILPWVQAEPVRIGSGHAAFRAERERLAHETQ